MMNHASTAVRAALLLCVCAAAACESTRDGRDSHRAGPAETPAAKGPRCEAGLIEPDMATLPLRGPAVGPDGQLSPGGAEWLVSTTYLALRPGPEARARFKELEAPNPGHPVSRDRHAGVQRRAVRDVRELPDADGLAGRGGHDSSRILSRSCASGGGHRGAVPGRRRDRALEDVRAGGHDLGAGGSCPGRRPRRPPLGVAPRKESPPGANPPRWRADRT